MEFAACLYLQVVLRKSMRATVKGIFCVYGAFDRGRTPGLRESANDFSFCISRGVN